MRAFVLAGGFATRLWPLTERRAKPLLPLAGKPLLNYTIDSIPAEIPVTVSTNAVFAEDFTKWKASIKRSNVSIVIEDAGHEDQKLGALGAVAKWIQEEKIDDDILLLAGDNYAEFSLADFTSQFQGKPLVAGHDIGEIDLAKRFGTIVLEWPVKADKMKPIKVTGFEEKPAHPKSTIVSTGWSIIPKTALSVLKDHARSRPDDIGGIFEEFLRRNIDVDCVVFQGLWKDIGSFDAYLALHCDIVQEKTITGRNVRISPDSSLKGSIDIGEETVITQSSLTDCIVFGHSTIQDCVLTRCIIDEGCILKGVDLTDQMLRAGTELQRKGL